MHGGCKILAVALALSGAVRADEATLGARLADALQVRYELVANGLTTDCPPVFAGGGCFEVRLSFTVPADVPASAEGWQFYFSETEPVLQADSTDFTVRHLNGDLHRLVPTTHFTGFRAGTSYAVTLWGAGSHLSEYYAMPNAYVVDDTGQAHTVKSTMPQIDPETGLEQLPFVVPFSHPERQHKRTPDDQTPAATPAWLYEHYGLVTIPENMGMAAMLIPSPKQVITTDGTLDLGRGIAVSLIATARADISAALDRLRSLGVMESPTGVPLLVRLKPTADAMPGSYQLTVAAEGITVDGNDAEGVQNALMSLAGLIGPGAPKVPLLVIDDAPRFAYRGLHLDLARNFNSKTFILKVLDQMASFKLNKLTLQLSDDEGWRLALDGLPDLTGVGGQRCHDPSENRCLMPALGSGPTGAGVSDGFFSSADYIEIVKAANARHIEVIPFFDMPGHARAAVRAMEARYHRLMAAGNPDDANAMRLVDPADTTVYDSIQHYDDNTINVCIPSTYAFIGKLVDAIAALHVRAGQPLRHFHIGADETPGAWRASPACRALIDQTPELNGPEDLDAYFVERASGLLAAHGIVPAGWGDGFVGTDPARMPTEVTVFAWAPIYGGAAENAHTLANRGWQTIISTPDATYLDAPYAADPEERGFDWASRATDSRKIFGFMPENLPAHAEIWTDAEGHGGELADPVPLKPRIRFAGLQAELWSETVRTDDQAAYMLFPRLLAFAERAWHKADWEVPYTAGRRYSPESHFFDARRRAAREADWARFATAVGTQVLPALDAAGLPYRIPPVGAVIEAGHLRARLPYPGLTIEYRLAGGAWRPYTGEDVVTAPVELRARSADGRRAGRKVTIEKPQ